MLVYQGEPRIQYLVSPRDWVSQLVFITLWNPKEVGSNASEVMDLPARTSVERESKLLPAGCQQEVWPELEVDLPTLKIPF